MAIPAWLALAGVGLGTSVLSGVSSAVSNKQSYKYATALQAQQYQNQRNLNRNAYQDATYSMRQAGLNPMLTIANGASGGSAGTAGFNAQNPELESGINTAMAAKQLKNETELKDSQKDLNNSAESLNNYLGDKAHYESALAREQTQLLQEYGPLERQAQIEGILVNNAKVRQDMANSIRLTDSQIGVNSAVAKYNNERARGYTESYSISDGNNNSRQIGIKGIGGSSSGGYHHSMSGSRTY